MMESKTKYWKLSQVGESMLNMELWKCTSYFFKIKRTKSIQRTSAVVSPRSYQWSLHKKRLTVSMTFNKFQRILLSETFWSFCLFHYGLIETALEASKWLNRQVPRRYSGSSSSVFACTNQKVSLSNGNIENGIGVKAVKKTRNSFYLYQECHFNHEFVKVTKNKTHNSSCNSWWPNINAQLKITEEMHRNLDSLMTLHHKFT